jgi:hypothetical protein
MKFRYFIIHRFLLRSKIFFAFLFGQTWCGMMTSREPAGQSCTAGNEIPPCARLCCCRWFCVCVCVCGASLSVLSVSTFFTYLNIERGQKEIFSFDASI